MSATVGDVAAGLSEEFPTQWAEPWDEVGLLAGFASKRVSGILVTLDPSEEALARAVERGANLIVTHHPAFLHPPKRLTEDAAPLVVRALASGVSLLAAHTNLDRSPAGGDALSLALGLNITAPLESAAQPVDVVVTYVPAASAESVAEAMSAAGAGRIGLYEGCSFTSPGTGRYTPMTGANPAVGVEGADERTEETRIEMVAPRGGGHAVAEAARHAHPYEEPVVLVVESDLSRGAARLGRICVTGGATVRELAQDVASRLQVAPRVIGDPDSLVETVAVAGGSGGSLLHDALASQADAFVVGELRYHDALAAASAGLVIVEIGHDASEWPLVEVLAAAVGRTAGLDVPIAVDSPGSLYWTP